MQPDVFLDVSQFTVFTINYIDSLLSVDKASNICFPLWPYCKLEV